MNGTWNILVEVYATSQGGQDGDAAQVFQFEFENGHWKGDVDDLIYTRATDETKTRYPQEELISCEAILMTKRK